MKRKLLPFAMLLSTIMLAASCLNDDNDEYVFYDDTAITSFSVGTLNQYLHTTSSKGTDSTYLATVDCSGYKFYIDQQKREVYNPDSLPYGIDAKKVLCTITCKNSGTALLKSLTSDSLSYLSSTDSTDFSQPRTVQVFSNSGQVSREYTIRVNVHKETPDSFKWKRMADIPGFASMQGMKAVECGGRTVVFGYNGTATTAFATADGGKTWQNIALNLGHEPAADFYKGIIARAGTIYAADGGNILSSSDAETWQSTPATGDTPARLVAASRAKLYGYSASGAMVESSDNGATWTASPLDDDASLLPQADLSFVCSQLKTNPEADRVTLIGNPAQSSDTTATVWGRIDETAEGSLTQPWAYYNIASDNKHPIPRLEGAQATAYDDAILLFGGQSATGSTPAFSTIFKSRDGGITWKADTTLAVPSDYAKTAAFAFFATTDNFVWIINGAGQVWKGRINRLGWREEQTDFTE